ncbi:MAG: peptidylprolyl isomerase [Bacilli bacterium]
MKKYLLLLLCIPLLLTGCKKVPKLENGQEIVAQIDGKQFTANELFDALKKDYGTSVLVGMVDELITSKEITDEMKEEAKKSAKNEFDTYKTYYSSNWSAFLANYGYKTDDELMNALIKSYQQKLILTKYLKNDVIKDEEINKYYKDNIFGEITARHILIKPDVKDDMTADQKKEAKTKALNEAKELIEQLKKSTNLEADFTKLAKEKSDDTGSASQGGLIENFTNDSGLVKEFWEASLKLETGKFTPEAVETEYGYHIIYKVSQKEKPTLDKVKDKVIDKVANELLAAENANFVYWSGLREKYNIVIHDDVIKNAYQATLNNLKK